MPLYYGDIWREKYKGHKELTDVETFKRNSI